VDNVSLIGIGKLGLCLALTFEKFGYNVVGCDISPDYVQKINDKVFNSDEEGVNDALETSKNFEATTSLKKCVEHSNILFLLVATPSLSDGKYDHSQIDSVVEQLLLMPAPLHHKQLIVCCTTMPEYCDTVQARLQGHNYTVSYNPEFIAQGTILRDQENTSLVLIGEGSSEAGDIIQKIYEKTTVSTPTIARMSRHQAEICKISLNCFLTTKISFANMIGDIARFSGLDPDPILKAIGSESRISPLYLNYGYGYGGPCFPRDNRALAIYAKEKGVDALISAASDEFNTQHLKYQLELFKHQHDISEPILFEYITYKPQSTMLVESQQLLFAKTLAEEGYKVCIRERKSVIQELKKLYGDLFLYEERTDEL
jgi:nucleotide sugar dehydrogenase